MEDKASRGLHLLLFYLGWVGILWAVYVFLLNSYSGDMSVFTEDPSYFMLLCVSLMSIAIASRLERAGQTKK